MSESYTTTHPPSSAPEVKVAVKIDVPESIYKKAQTRCQEQQEQGHDLVTVIDNLLDLVMVEPQYYYEGTPIEDR